MLTLSQKTRGIIAMLLGLVLAHANPVAARAFFEKEPRGNGPYQQQPEQRPNAQRNEVAEERRPQRFSPEERRQLRRDIKDAGREIYPQRR